MESHRMHEDKKPCAFTTTWKPGVKETPSPPGWPAEQLQAQGQELQFPYFLMQVTEIWFLSYLCQICGSAFYEDIMSIQADFCVIPWKNKKQV